MKCTHCSVHGNRDAKVFYKKFQKPVYIMDTKYDKYIDKET